MKAEKDALLLKKVASFIRKEELIRKGDRLIIACSGGPDSLALLDMLCRLRETFSLQLTACYVHHGIRKAADKEVVRVQEAAAKRHCDFVWHYVDIPAIASTRHISIETAGREERYRILRAVAREKGASSIAVAHQQNDQAETILQHLLRGSGLNGLAGMQPKNGVLIRPLLALTRQEVERYISLRGLTPCQDETNASTAYGRNRIRLELLPYLEKYNPSVIADLNRLAQIAGADEAYLEAQAEALGQTLIQTDGNAYYIEKKMLLEQPLALQRRLIRILFRDIRQSRLDIPWHYTENVRELAAKGAGHCFEGNGVCVYTTKRYLYFIRAERGAFKKCIKSAAGKIQEENHA